MITVEPGYGKVPFEIKCDRCADGFARSQFYDLGHGDLKRAEYIFYWPMPAELRTPFDRWRFANGQLFLRRIM